jgi:PAS domain S-box-containing protein
VLRQGSCAALALGFDVPHKHRPALPFLCPKKGETSAGVWGHLPMNIAGSAKAIIPAGRDALRAANYLLEFLILAVTYFGLTAALSLLPSINVVATPLWPPSGFALSLVLLRGERIIPALLAGICAFHVMVGSSFISSAVAGIGTLIASMAGARLLNTWSDGRMTFASPVAIAKFTAVAFVPTAVLSSCFAVGSLAIENGDTAAIDLAHWIKWWLADAASILLVTPLILLWATTSRQDLTHRRLLETFAIIVAAVAIGGLAFGPAVDLGGGFNHLNLNREFLGFVFLLPLLWAGLRGNQRGVATAAAVFCGMALCGYASGTGLFSKRDVDQSLLLLFMLILSTTIPALTLAAAIAIRQNTEAQLRTAQDYLKRRVEQTASALTTAKHHFQILLEGVEDHAIFALDAAGKVVNWNSAALQILGYTAQDMMGLQFEVFYRQEDRLTGEPNRTLRAATQKNKHQVEGWRVRKNGSLFFVTGSVSSIRDPAGNLVGFANVLRDLTERRDAQEKLVEAREQLATAQKMEAIGKLTGGIAHDFNNLLMIIGGNAETFRRLLDPKLPRAIEAIQIAAKRGEALTRQLLTFSRRQHLRPTTIDLAVCIKNLRPMIESSLRGNIIYNEKIATNLWPVEVDLAELELAIVNIAVNARDAMPNGGVFTLSVELAPADHEVSDAQSVGPFIAIKCTDTGTGIPSDLLPKIFDPYFTTKEVGKGTGLGLSQVHGFAYQAGGTVTAESQLGEGTSITIYLPCRADKELSAPAINDPNSQRPKVLIVDDSAEVAEVTSSLFEQLGYSSVYGDSADAALNLLAGGTTVDLVFSDIVMPGSIDGIGLAAEVRSRYPTLPVLLTTGYSEVLQAAPSNLKILRKPFDADALKNFVQEFAEAD